MGAKKTLSSPSKQHNLSAVVKKVTTLKQKDIDIKSSKEKEKIKLTSSEVKKSVIDSKTVVATSNTKKTSTTKLAANNVRAIVTNKEDIKKSQSAVVDLKKNNNKDNDNDKCNSSKKQNQALSMPANNSKTNKCNKTNDIECERSNENKLHLISSVDNKFNVKSEDSKSNCNLNGTDNKKDAGKLNSLLTKSTCENLMKSNKKELDNKSKKIVDKSRLKALKKGVMTKNKDNNNKKIKISNELKNLGIEMIKSNTTFDSIQDGLTSEMKTSICEMVKLKKARPIPSSGNSNLSKAKSSVLSSAVKNAEVSDNNKCHEKVEAKDSQEKIKKNEPKSKTWEKSATSSQFKINDKAKNSIAEKSKNEKNSHISVNLTCIKPTLEKKSSNQDEKIESEVKNKSYQSENSKTLNRKNMKKKKIETDTENRKEEQNVKKSNETKSNLTNLPQMKVVTGEKKSKVEQIEEVVSQKTKNQNIEVKDESSNELPIQKNKSNEDLKAALSKKSKGDKSSTGKNINMNKNISSEKIKQIKRKYTRKVIPAIKQIIPSKTISKNASFVKIKSIIKTDKNSDNIKHSNLAVISQKDKQSSVVEKQPKTSTVNAKTKIFKEKLQSAKNNHNKKLNIQNKLHRNNNNIKVKVEDKSPSIVQKTEKVCPSKQKKTGIEEKDPLRLSTSESDSVNSDSDMELSDDIFMKPTKPKSQKPIQKKKIKKIEVIKKSRVASLNAIAKVHCLYENEARSHLDTAFSKTIKKHANVISHVSSEDDEDEESDNKKTECVLKRSLRTVPGLRAIGKHWEMDSLSSDIDSDTDTIQRVAKEPKKLKPVAKAATPKSQDHKYKPKVEAKSSQKLKNQVKKMLKSTSKITNPSDGSQRDSDKEIEKKKQKISPASKKSLVKTKGKKGSIKQKNTKDEDKSNEKNVVTKKRMASLNASAILAASYENYAAKHESSSTETSDDSDNENDEIVKKEKEVIDPPTMKKEKKDVKIESTEENRPKSSTNLVKIDTDVTITGVYVNSALVSSQETICKTLKYRTAYSVTEECVVSRPPTQEPPKSYTPLSALTNMRPPNGGNQMPTDQCMSSPSDQYQPQVPPQQSQPQMYDPHLGPPYQYQYPPPPPSHPMPSTSSAFYPPQPIHRGDPMGYYQPAGPLISPHLLQPPPSLEGDQQQSNQQTSGAADNVDPDVMITGGDLAPRALYRYGPPAPDFSRPLHPQQMHYPPSYPPYYYGQHPPPPPPVTHQDLCYPYYPPKYFPTNSPYARRPYVSPGYYQPPPLVPQNAPQQIAPTAPTPQHIDPHYSNSPYYPGPSAYNTSGQCYSQTPPRNLQPPYLEAHQYHSASCPCPMQSCQSKNVHTGTGPTKANGPVSACNGMAEPLPKSSIQSNGSGTQPMISCKVENLLSPNVVIKPENDKLGEATDNRLHSHMPSVNYSMNVKALDAPDLSPSPSRGSIGIQQIPTVQHEAAAQPTENSSCDDASLSYRKQARIGKSMERDRQQQQQQQHQQKTTLTGYHNHPSNDVNALMDIQHLKQEYPVKKESDMKKEKDCEELTMKSFSSYSNAANIKVEKPENENYQRDSASTSNTNRIETPVMQNEISTENDTVNSMNESSDECGIDYSKKRKLIDNDDVIELSDNSTLDLPGLMPVVKRRKLLEKPISTPKKSPPNSYKSLIKQNKSAAAAAEDAPETIAIETTSAPTTPISSTTKPKLFSSSSIGRISNKSSIKRKSILKSKSTFKTVRFTAKAKRRALQKKKQQFLQQRKRVMTTKNRDILSDKLSSSSINIDENVVKLNDKNRNAYINTSLTYSTQINGDDKDISSSATNEKEKLTFDICEQVSNEASENNEEKSMDGSSEYSGKSNIDLTIDRVAKGYFSESEIFSSLSKHRKTKGQKRFEAKLLDLCEKEKKKKRSKENNNINSNILNKTKDKSLHVPEKSEKSKKKIEKVNEETKDAKHSVISSTITKESQPSSSNNSNNKKTSTNKPKKTKTKEPKEVEHNDFINEKQKEKKEKGKKTEKPTIKKISKESTNEKDTLKLDSEDLPSSYSTAKVKQKASTSKKLSATKKQKTDEIEIKPSIDSNILDENEDKKAEDTKAVEIRPSELVKSRVIDETDVANNNDEFYENNNSKQKQQEPLTLYKTPGYGWTTALVKASRRGKKPKYTNRKKVRLTLPNDIVIPKCTSIPRWSNGWVWEGQPYQALVFLNSDDPPVPRTCYDSMKHEECGDVIRPRDCVLLRAGGKRNELPYVAKVAQLWENPEDGEMMMSLFWYYRPEHTEQGRQNTDAIDEVFASRHKDHNSVACIEDKCYVITYNEYCRYRKMLRSVEENIEEPPSLVPKLQTNDRRLVPPPNTSPELVMFCRRVYDFRGKRLTDDKKRK